MAYRVVLTSHPTSRRSLLKTMVFFGGAGAIGLPRVTLARGPNATLNLAAVGVGGQGASDLRAAARGEGVRIVALCDVDANNLVAATADFDDARAFTDYRVMFDEMGDDIDAVVVSTPDHMHGAIALAAMQLGKHVYVQKPLAHNLAELRAMQQAAADNPRLVTQMGTQIHSHEAYRTAVATLRAGAIGKVREAHLWVSKSWAGPPEGRPARADTVPPHLAWDLWLGVAPERPYVRGSYHPANWRGWIDFGSGTLGDMGCHIFDPVFSCLDLGMPTHVVSKGPAHHPETFAPDSDIRYRFDATRHTTDGFTMRWTDGSGASRPDASRAQLPDGERLPGAGSFLVGERGVMVIPHWDTPRFYRDGQALDVPLERRESNDHYTEFTDACRGVGKTSTPFSYSARVTEAVLVGTVAGRFRDRELAWDSPRLAFDDAEATRAVHRTYRDGRDVVPTPVLAGER